MRKKDEELCNAKAPSGYETNQKEKKGHDDEEEMKRTNDEITIHIRIGATKVQSNRSTKNAMEKLCVGIAQDDGIRRIEDEQ